MSRISSGERIGVFAMQHGPGTENSFGGVAQAFGARVVPVAGTYDQVNRLSVEVSDELGWAFLNVTLRPYYAEGSKTLAYETVEQLGWELPDRVVCPIASGSLFTKVGCGFQEWLDLGLVGGKQPVFNGAQAAGCSPVADAFESGKDVCRPVKPETIARRSRATRSSGISPERARFGVRSQTLAFSASSNVRSAMSWSSSTRASRSDSSAERCSRRRLRCASVRRGTMRRVTSSRVSTPCSTTSPSTDVGMPSATSRASSIPDQVPLPPRSHFAAPV